MFYFYFICQFKNYYLILFNFGCPLFSAGFVFFFFASMYICAPCACLMPRKVRRQHSFRGSGALFWSLQVSTFINMAFTQRHKHISKKKKFNKFLKINYKEEKWNKLG